MSVLSIEILFGSNETLFVRQTWKRLKESFHSCIVRATFTQDSLVMFWTKSQRQQNCHETSALYSSCCLWPADFAFNLFYVACLLGWKISRLFQDTKVYEPPQYQPRWSWQKPEINSIYRTVFSLALTEHRYLGGSDPCFHLSCAFVTSLMCPRHGGQKDTLYSALTHGTAPRSLRQLPGVTHIVLAIKELGTPNSKVSLGNWELHMNSTCVFEPLQCKILLYHIYTCS